MDEMTITQKIIKAMNEFEHAKKVNATRIHLPDTCYSKFMEELKTTYTSEAVATVGIDERNQANIQLLNCEVVFCPHSYGYLFTSDKRHGTMFKV